jgi:type I restriction enzyme, R subunit
MGSIDFPNWKRIDNDLRQARQEATFAICSEEDDEDKVADIVEKLFTLLSKPN